MVHGWPTCTEAHRTEKYPAKVAPLVHMYFTQYYDALLLVFPFYDVLCLSGINSIHGSTISSCKLVHSLCPVSRGRKFWLKLKCVRMLIFECMGSRAYAALEDQVDPWTRGRVYYYEDST